MATNNYAINYDDERFKTVENEKKDRLNEVNNTYNSMIDQSDQFYQSQIDAAKDYANTQQNLQNEQTQLAIDEINQQKDKANKDYLKEQRGAYSDWQKESNRYGVNAEQQAANGMRNTGYSESSQVSLYNTYQNRVATARESYNLAIQNYDNGIKEARLANNSKLAEIAYQALQTELELSLNGFQYKNQLLTNQINMQNDINNQYYTRWQNVLSQMNTENALAEQIRQYNTNMKFQKAQAKQAQKNWEKEYALSKKAYSSARRSSGSSGSRTKKSDTTPKLAKPKDNKDNNKIYQSTSTPILSSKAAQSWLYKFNNSIKNSSGEFKVSGTKLSSELSSAYKNKTLTESDVSKILKSYGAN